MSVFLKNTTWRIDCKRCEYSLWKWVYLREDGLVGVRYEPFDEFEYDGTDRWHVKDGWLIVTWSSGYSVETFHFARPTDTTAAGKKGSKPVTIVRV